MKRKKYRTRPSGEVKRKQDTRNLAEPPISEQRAKKPKKQQRGGHRGIVLFLFGVLLLYLCGYMVVFLNRPTTPVVTVSYGSIDTPIQLFGVLVRDEIVIKSDKGGQAAYLFQDKERVRKNDVVCSIKDGETVDTLETKIEEIDRDIVKAQKARKDLSPFLEDIKRLEGGIEEAIDAYATKSMSNDFTSLYTMKGQVVSAISQRNEIWLVENASGLSQLSKEKMQYESELAKSKVTIKAPESGIITFSVDGMEETVTPATIAQVGKEQIKMKTPPQYISQTQKIIEGAPLFRLLTSNNWRIVSYVSKDISGEWKAGDTKYLTAYVDEESKAFPAHIEAISDEGDEMRVVFYITQNILDFLDKRQLEFSLQSDTLQGIKVPNTAIVERTLLKLPLNSITESLGEKGVLKVSGKNGDFVKTTIAYMDEVEKTVYVLQEDTGLKLGDMVLVGTGKDATEYTISEVATKFGVYQANSSIARFVMVDILGQNQEVAILRPGNGSYNIRAYDTIVSDAKNIVEGQKV